jgi:alpha-1,3-glucosyltransferase
MKKVIFCGVSVVSVMILAFFPFRGDLVAVKNRLFPWGRGLTHAYWAPNFWSLYNAIDVLLNFFLNKQFKTEYTQGLVRICNHAVLPNVTPPATFALILAGLVFLAWFIQRSDNSMFCESLSVSGMIFFMFGWHVHEKAIMTISLPMM